MLKIEGAVIFWAAVVELQLIGGAASGVVVKTAGQFSEVGLALELILAIVLGDRHIQSIPIAYNSMEIFHRYLNKLV